MSRKCKPMCLTYDDYIKLRNAKVGEVVELSFGEVVRTSKNDPSTRFAGASRCSANTGLDYYDHTYEG